MPQRNQHALNCSHKDAKQTHASCTPLHLAPPLLPLPFQRSNPREKCTRPPSPQIKLSWEMIEAAGSPAAYLPMPYSSVGQVHCRTGSVSKHNDLVSKQAAQTHNLTGQCTSALLSHSTHHSLLMCCDPKGATHTALLPLPQLTHKLAGHKNSSTPAQSRISRT